MQWNFAIIVEREARQVIVTCTSFWVRMYVRLYVCIVTRMRICKVIHVNHTRTHHVEMGQVNRQRTCVRTTSLNVLTTWKWPSGKRGGKMSHDSIARSMVQKQMCFG